jgi:hypothetical protein
MAIRRVHAEKMFQLLPGLHGHSASLHDELGRICRKSDLFYGCVERCEVRLAIIKLGNSYTQEDDIRASCSVARVGSKHKQSSSTVALDQFGEVWFIDGKSTSLEQTDTFRVAIGTDYVMADGGQATSGDQSHVAATDDRDSQKFLLR